MYKTTFLSILLLVCLTITKHSHAQNSSILESYESFSYAPRELAYVHLNKSTYIKGEMIGFTAYVFDKFTKEPSTVTTNLYCTISDKAGVIIKEKLIKIEKGIAANVFQIDSSFSNDIYTFKAFTNWMKNFDEQNHFEQTFKVIDSDNLSLIKPIDSKDISIDLQVLGEGGHLVYDVTNSIGIIAKNQFGYGVANAFGSIKDGNGNIVSEFQLNDVGLAKALFTPKTNQTYSVNLNLNNKTLTQPIAQIKSNGIVLTLNSSDEKVSILIKTNKNTLKPVKKYQIALHNGSAIALSPFEFNTDGIAVISYLKKELFNGINIFTVFDDKDNPLLERLFFNNRVIKNKVSKVSLKEIKDSLEVTLKIDNIKKQQWSNLSISILPSDTKSYNHHNNILSQIYIQPYIKGYIEKGSRYFETKTRKTDYEIDLLMLTQGWSSYSWSNIFSDKNKKYIYPFERGIDVVANLSNKKYGSYVFYPLSGSSTQLFSVSKHEKSFTIKTLFPNEDDLFRIGYIDSKKKNFNEKPSLYLQFYPSQFADFNNKTAVIKQAYTRNETFINPNKNKDAWDNSDITKLDEVVVKAETKYTKFEALNEKSFIKRYVLIKENIKKRGMRIDTYLERLGFLTDYDIFSGKLSIVNPRGALDKTPLVYLDNALLTTDGRNSDFGILTFITMDLVDYIEYEPYGIGGGIRGSGGYIKIFTAPGTQVQKKSNSVVTYKVPLLFNKEKTFYTPKYQYYNTGFFEEYGTIAWDPKVKIGEDGLASLRIFDTKTQNMSLFVEGIINGNQYISQEIKIERDN